MQLHTYCGSELLSNHASTLSIADVAYGHHCNYDEKGGYPLAFSPRGSKVRAMIYLVAVAKVLAEASADGDIERALAALTEGAGTRYAPCFVDLLRAPERRSQLREDLGRWSREACEDLFRRKRDMLGGAELRDAERRDSI